MTVFDLLLEYIELGKIQLDKSIHSLATAYHDIQFWPERASCGLSGPIRADQQNTRQGGSGALEASTLSFEVIGIDLIGYRGSR